MSYRFEADETLSEGVRRITEAQIDRAQRSVSDAEVSVDEAVHDLRKRTKKIRGLLRLARPGLGDTYGVENAWFRDTARLLSDARDEAAHLETLDAMQAVFEDERAPLSAVADALEAQRSPQSKAVLEALERASRRLETARVRVGGWTLDPGGFEALYGGLKRTYARGRRAWPRAYEAGTTEAFHEWRKRAKYHRYHADLLKNAWKEPLKTREDELHAMTDLLGEEHDLAELRGTLEARRDALPSEATDRTLDLIRERRETLRVQAYPLAMRIWAEKPKRFCRRIGAYWRAWTLERSGPVSGAERLPEVA